MTSTVRLDHPLILKIQSILQDQCSWNPTDTIVVAVSGGPDSVALLKALTFLQQSPSDTLVIAHFNHRTRGDESFRDELFVQNLARSLSIPIVVGYLDKMIPAGVSKEHFWRQERYRFLESVRLSSSARFIATGHTRDDQIETILFRLITGASSGSLRGIAPIRSSTIIRPLLSASRNEIIAFLDLLGQAYLEDRSNSDSRYPRNYIRRCIIPLIHTINPAIETALSNLIENQTIDSDYFALIIDPLIEQITIPGTISLPGTELHSSNHTAVTRRYAGRILNRIAELNDMRVTRSMVLNLSDLLNRHRNRMTVPDYLIKWHKHSVWIVPISVDLPDTDPAILLPGESIVWNRYRVSATADPPGMTGCRLTIRHPLPGDILAVDGRLVPLVKALTERGLPSELRRCVPVIIDAFDQIAAVVLPGHQKSLIRTCFLPDFLQLQWEII